MNKIKITLIGLSKNKEIKTLIDDYRKRMKFFCNLKINEVNESSESGVQRYMRDMKEKMEPLVDNNDYIIVLDSSGQNLTSPQFADIVKDGFNHNFNTLHFFIGGHLGLPVELLQASKKMVSFSSITMPYQILNLVFFEQLYRSFTINSGQKHYK